MIKNLFNRSELRVYRLLRSGCIRRRLHVFPKIRVSDVLLIEGSGLSDDLFTYALKAHFDFVVTDNEYQPLLAIEVDGEAHQDGRQLERDARKDQLCQDRGFSLKRLKVASIVVPNHRDESEERLLESWLNSVLPPPAITVSPGSFGRGARTAFPDHADPETQPTQRDSLETTLQSTLHLIDIATSVIHASIAVFRAVPRLLRLGFLSLPDWLQPILIGLAVSGAILGIAFLILDVWPH